jgi:YidC/Oxa1 family membrane protein insertase
MFQTAKSRKRLIKVVAVIAILYIIFWHFDTFIKKPIFNILFFIYNFIGDFGVAVILLTILVRLALWPLIRRQLHQTKLMRNLQPELKKIHKQANGNRMLESTLMMELYREKGVKTSASFLPLLIQLPIFFALYQVIRVFAMQHDQIAHYTYSWLKGLSRISNVLADPGSFHQHFLGILDLSKGAIAGGKFYWPALLIALIAALFQYFQTKQTLPQAGEHKKLRQIMNEAADGKQPDQSEMQAATMGGMMKIMPLFTLLITVSFPSVIALYYATTSGIAIFQQHLVLGRDEDDMEKLAEKSDKKRRKSKREKNTKEAVVVKQPDEFHPKKSAAAAPAKKSKSSGTVVRRIKAK